MFMRALTASRFRSGFRLALVAGLMLPLLAGCGRLTTPTLHVRAVPAVPEPNALIEQSLWEPARPLRVELVQAGGQTLPAELRAIHDGRALSILLTWADPTESIVHQSWSWNPARQEWLLRTFANDRAWLLFPLTPAAPLDLLVPPSAQYDLWEWQSAWSNASGYADDKRLLVDHHPGPHPPEPREEAVIYSARRGGGFVQIGTLADEGLPGTIIGPRPPRSAKRTIVDAASAHPRAAGSIIDVGAQGDHRKDLSATTTIWETGSQRQPGQWFGETPLEDRPGSYYVEYYRLLHTEDLAADYQFEGRGPHRFAVAVFDVNRGGDPFISRPLRLVFSKLPDSGL